MHSCRGEAFAEETSVFEGFIGLCKILNKPHMYSELHFISCDLCLCRWLYEFHTTERIKQFLLSFKTETKLVRKLSAF